MRKLNTSLILALLIPVSSLAQNTSGEVGFNRKIDTKLLQVIPDNADFSGKFQITDIAIDTGVISMNCQRRTGNLADLQFELYVLFNEVDVKRKFNDLMPNGPVGEWKSFSGRRVGQECYSYSANTLNNSSKSIVIRDNFCVLKIILSGKPIIIDGKVQRMPNNLIKVHNLYLDDSSLIEKIVLRTLDRLTYLGMTSKPVTSASEDAKKYVIQKKDNPPKIGSQFLK